MEDIKKLLLSFKYAGAGIVNTVLGERNMRIHTIFMIYMYSILALSDWFTLSRTDWALIFIANAIVTMGELVNTAVEKTVDLVTEEKHPLAKAAKDAAAGAVLICAIFAVCVGICVLFQKDAFVSMYEYFKGHVIALVCLAISLVPAFAFIFKGLPFLKGKEKK